MFLLKYVSLHTEISYILTTRFANIFGFFHHVISNRKTDFMVYVFFRNICCVEFFFSTAPLPGSCCMKTLGWLLIGSLDVQRSLIYVLTTCFGHMQSSSFFYQRTPCGSLQDGRTDGLSGDPQPAWLTHRPPSHQTSHRMAAHQTVTSGIFQIHEMIQMLIYVSHTFAPKACFLTNSISASVSAVIEEIINKLLPK